MVKKKKKSNPYASDVENDEAEAAGESSNDDEPWTESEDLPKSEEKEEKPKANEKPKAKDSKPSDTPSKKVAGKDRKFL